MVYLLLTLPYHNALCLFTKAPQAISNFALNKNKKPIINFNFISKCKCQKTSNDMNCFHCFTIKSTTEMAVKYMLHYTLNLYFTNTVESQY